MIRRMGHSRGLRRLCSRHLVSLVGRAVSMLCASRLLPASKQAARQLSAQPAKQHQCGCSDGMAKRLIGRQAAKQAGRQAGLSGSYPEAELQHFFDGGRL